MPDRSPSNDPPPEAFFLEWEDQLGETQEFYVADVLTVVKSSPGRALILGPRGMGGPQGLMEFMVGEELHTFQQGRVLGEVRGQLAADHPDLVNVPLPEGISDPRVHRRWLNEIVRQFGPLRSVRKLGADDHTSIDFAVEAQQIGLRMGGPVQVPSGPAPRAAMPTEAVESMRAVSQHLELASECLLQVRRDPSPLLAQAAFNHVRTAKLFSRDLERAIGPSKSSPPDTQLRPVNPKDLKECAGLAFHYVEMAVGVAGRTENAIERDDPVFLDGCSVPDALRLVSLDLWNAENVMTPTFRVNLRPSGPTPPRGGIGF